MNHVLPWLVCLGMIMYQFHAALSLHLMLSSRFMPELLFLPAAGYCIGIVAGWVAVSVVDVRSGDTGRVTPSGEKVARFAFLAVFMLAACCVRLYLFDEWQSPAARAAIQMGSGLLLVIAHWLFFTCLQIRQQASLYCGALATGFALAEIYFQIMYTGTVGSTVPLHRTLIFTTMIYALILGGGLWMAMRAATDRTNNKTDDSGSIRVTCSLVLVLVLLYLLHGMVDGSFLPFHTASRIQDNRLAATALTVVALGFAAWLFRDGVSRMFRLVITVCGFMHMAMAVFSLFSSDLLLIRSLHILIGPVQYLFITMMVCALAKTAPRRWRVVAVTIPFALKAVEILFIPLLIRSIVGKGEALPLAAILVAVVFYAFGRRINLAQDALPEARLLEPDLSKATAEEDHLIACRQVVRELGDRHGFSARERQVGELLASGLPADHIGERLGLSTNTVNTYVRRIVIKTGCDGRRGFVAMAQGGLHEKE